MEARCAFGGGGEGAILIGGWLNEREVEKAGFVGDKCHGAMASDGWVKEGLDGTVDRGTWKELVKKRVKMKEMLARCAAATMRGKDGLNGGVRDWRVMRGRRMRGGEYLQGISKKKERKRHTGGVCGDYSKRFAGKAWAGRYWKESGRSR